MTSPVDPDSKLAAVLAKASPSDTVRAILVPKEQVAPEPVDSADYTSRKAFRAALRTKLAEAVEAARSPMRDDLAALEPDGLVVTPTDLSATIVIEGPAPVVEAALAIDSVGTAALDTDVDVETFPV